MDAALTVTLLLAVSLAVCTMVLVYLRDRDRGSRPPARGPGRSAR